MLDAPRDSWPPSALRAFWEPIRDSSELRLKGPRHESRWFNLAGYCLRPGTGYPAGREPDQGPLAGLPPGGQAHQGLAVLGRLVGLLAAGRRRPEPGPPRGDPSRLVPFLLPAKGGAPPRSCPGRSPRPTSWPRSGDAPRRSSGWPRTSRNRSETPWSRTWRGRTCRRHVALVPRAARGSGPALWPGQHRGAVRKGPAMGPCRSSTGPSPRAGRPPTRSSPSPSSPGSPATGPGTSTSRSGSRSSPDSKTSAPTRRPYGPSGSSTNSKPRSKARPSAMPCRRACCLVSKAGS